MFAAAFALVGAFFIVRSFAAISPNAKVVEAEAYETANNTTITADTSASGSNYTQFDAVSTTPPPPPSGGSSSFCSSFPSMPSVKPDTSNTGVPAGTALTAYTGPQTVSIAGTTIDSKDITDTLTIAASNVTIKNSKIHPPGGSATFGIKINSGTNIKILNSEIYTSTGAYVGIYGGNFTACGNYIHGWENGITTGDNNYIIQANYFDKLASGQPGPHYDGIEVYGGNGGKVWGNNIRMTEPSGVWLTETGAINLTSWNSNIDNTEIKGNWIGGGSYTMYVDEQSGFQATNVKVTDNRWYRNSAQFGTHLVRDDTSVTTWSGNVFDDNGQVIAM